MKRRKDNYLGLGGDSEVLEPSVGCSRGGGGEVTRLSDRRLGSGKYVLGGGL